MSSGNDATAGTRLAVAADREHIAATITAAFDQDPAFRAFFGHGSDFGDLAHHFAGAMADKRIAVEAAWLGAEGDAVALWNPPAGTAEMPAAVLDLPGPVAARLDEYDAAVEAKLTSEPHWYLGILASHPSRRGEGLARVVAEPGLAAAQAAGVPAVLETTNPDNVAMYERSGWRVTAELDVIGLHVWILQVDPS